MKILSSSPTPLSSPHRTIVRGGSGSNIKSFIVITGIVIILSLQISNMMSNNIHYFFPPIPLYTSSRSLCSSGDGTTGIPFGTVENNATTTDLQLSLPNKLSDRTSGENVTVKPSKINIRGAAMMLVTKPWGAERKGRSCYFNKSMDSLENYWTPNNPNYPIVLQHPDGWTQEEIHDIQQRWPRLDLIFTQNDRGFHEMDIPKVMEPGALNRVPLGYKKMCAYKTFGFLRSPMIVDHQIDYVMHIDDDSCLKETIPYDVFQVMQQNNIVYAYKQIFRDELRVVKGLVEFADKYMTRNNLTYANPALDSFLKINNYTNVSLPATEPFSFSTNLEWIDLNAYRAAPIQQFLTAIEYSQMIFHRRWGDAPLRFLLSYMFWNSKQVMQVCSSYHHSFWRVATSTCRRREKNDNGQDYDSTAFPNAVMDDAVLQQLKRCGRSRKEKCN